MKRRNKPKPENQCKHLTIQRQIIQTKYGTVLLSKDRITNSTSIIVPNGVGYTKLAEIKDRYKDVISCFKRQK